VPELSHRILEATDAPFYRSLAVALREFVALDLERLAGAMERVDAPLPNAGPEPAHSVEAAGARDCRR
jgi:hypothetical protein